MEDFGGPDAFTLKRQNYPLGEIERKKLAL